MKITLEYPFLNRKCPNLFLKKCQQWFKEIYGHKIKTNSELYDILTNKNTKYSLYRGLYVSGITRPYYVETASDNRRPKDTPLIIYNYINTALVKHGFTTHRGNSLFCTNSKNQAKVYSLDLNHILFFQ